MESNITNNIEEKVHSLNTLKYLIISGGIILVSTLIVFLYIFTSLHSENIHSNIKIMNINVSGMSRDNAVNKLKEIYSKSGNEKLILSFGQEEVQVAFSELNIVYYIEDAVQNAYNVGRNGGFFEKISQIISANLKKKTIEMPIEYNKEKLSSIMQKLEEPVAIKAIDDGYEFVDGNLVFNFGKEGRGFDEGKYIHQIEGIIKNGIGNRVILEVSSINPKLFDITSLSKEPVDAKYEIIDNKINYIKESYGVILDKKEFEELLNGNKINRTSFSVPAKVIKPKETVKSLQNKIFRDELGTHQTYYGSSSTNRKENVRLAASKIGEIILAPGQEFSYNNIVGPRTPERGFKMAHVYVNGEVVDGYGGGICQTSTTLYNSVLKSKLQVVERKNHIFTVPYASPGMDATVSYGSIDFRFKNNQEYPVKIVNETTPTNVVFKILGTRIENNENIEYRTEIIKTIPFEVEKVFDASLNVGESRVTQYGQNGFVVNVYKVVKKDDKIISNELISHDSYWPLKQKMILGTKLVIIDKEPPKLEVQESNSDEEIVDIDENYIQEPSVPVYDAEEIIDFQ